MDVRKSYADIGVVLDALCAIGDDETAHRICSALDDYEAAIREWWSVVYPPLPEETPAAGVPAASTSAGAAPSVAGRSDATTRRTAAVDDDDGEEVAKKQPPPPWKHPLAS